MDGQSLKFEFPNSEGQTLAGKLEFPDSPPIAYALFAHCFTCDKNISAATRISRGLRKYGIAVLRFDFTGLGNSDGDFSNTNFSSNADDLVAASKHLAEVYEPPKLLIGHSLGGTAALLAARMIEGLKAIVTIGAPSDPEHVANLFKDSLDLIESKGEHDVTLVGRKFTIKKQFLEDIQSNKVLGQLKELRQALLICHSPTDNTVSIDHARKIFDAAHHPKSFLALDGADHLVSAPESSEYLSAVINAWARKYIGGSYL